MRRLLGAGEAMTRPYMPQSARSDWATPQWLFDQLAAEFGPFDLDAAASSENAKCAKYFTKEENGLGPVWKGRVWLNPPYGAPIRDWLNKARANVNAGFAELVVCLLPSRTDTKWFHEIVQPHAAEIRFLKGRLTFEGAAGPAPFGSMVVVFRRAGL